MWKIHAMCASPSGNVCKALALPVGLCVSSGRSALDGGYPCGITQNASLRHSPPEQDTGRTGVSVLLSRDHQDMQTIAPLHGVPCSACLCVPLPFLIKQ